MMSYDDLDYRFSSRAQKAPCNHIGASVSMKTGLLSVAFLDLKGLYSAFMKSYRMTANLARNCPQNDPLQIHYNRAYLRLMGVEPHVDMHGNVIGYTKIPDCVSEYLRHPEREEYERLEAEKSASADVRAKRRFIGKSTIPNVWLMADERTN